MGLLPGVIALALLFLPGQADAQGAEPGRLEVAPVATLASAEAPLVPSTTQSVLRTGRGEYVVSHLYAEAGVALYGRGGEFASFVSLVGEGPGEFPGLSPSLFSGRGDTVYAVDGRLSNAFHFDGGLHHVHSARLDVRAGYDVSVLGGGRLAVARRIAQSDSLAHEVSILDRDGNLVTVLLETRDAATSPDGAVIAGSRSGGFWALRHNGWTLRRYSVDGELLEEVRLTPAWFPPASTNEPRGASEPPDPRHRGLSDLGGGAALLLTNLPDEEWESPFASNGTINRLEVDYGALYDTRLQLIDLETGRTIASATADEAFRHVQGAPGLVFSTHLDEALGHVDTRVWRVEVCAWREEIPGCREGG